MDLIKRKLFQLETEKIVIWGTIKEYANKENSEMLKRYVEDLKENEANIILIESLYKESLIT